MNRLKQFASFMDLIDVPTCLIEVKNDDTFVYVKINKALERISGFENKNLENKTPYEALSKRLADTLVKNYQVCAHTKRVFTYEGPLSPPTGENLWSFKLAPVLDEDKLIAILGFPNILDTDKEKEEERKFASALQEIQRVNTDLQVLSSTAAHDLRGPLRQAKLVNDMIIEALPEDCEEVSELVMLSDKILQKALSHIDMSLANLSAPEDIDVANSTIDVDFWCKDIIGVLDPLGRFDFATPNITIECEKFVLDIALRNLIDNALKYATSKVSLNITEEEGVLTFTVRDDGPGFDETLYAAGQTPPINNERSKSSGIGLTTVVRLIEQRAGKVWIAPPDDLFTGGAVSFSVRGTISNFKTRKVA